MKTLFQDIKNILNEELPNINQKITGTLFLEALKYCILQNYDNKEQNYNNFDMSKSESKLIIENDLKKISFNLIHFTSPKILLNSKIHKDLLIICLNETIKIDIEDAQKKSYTSIILKPICGITIPINTITNFHYRKNTFILEITSEDKNKDIEIQNISTI
tara:strand:- start:208 stop:690 length:483 start_codon:yes stop_codon:yes gene_type:complete